MNSNLPATVAPSRRTVIIAARHAEVHNPKNILYGRLPRFGLNDRGREQAHALARFVEGRPVAAIYSSPLLRARQTAEIIARYQGDLKVGYSRALLEVRTSYEGHSNSILGKSFSFYEPQPDPNDETIAQVFARIQIFLRRLLRGHAGETVVMVSHGDPLAIMRLGLLGEPFTVERLHKTVYPERASINQVVFQPNALPEITYFDVVEKI